MLRRTVKYVYQGDYNPVVTTAQPPVVMFLAAFEFPGLTRNPQLTSVLKWRHGRAVLLLTPQPLATEIHMPYMNF